MSKCIVTWINPTELAVFNPIETIVAFMRRAIAFLSGPWAHICDENKGFTQTPVTFLSYALSCWEWYHSKAYTVPFPMTYDTVVGGIENFCEILIWSHVT